MVRNVSEEEYYIPIAVRRYPFDADAFSYELNDPILATVLDEAVLEEIIKKKLMETNVAEIIKTVDMINESGRARASVELYDINVYLSKEEFAQLLNETIRTLRAKANFLEEHKEYILKVLSKEEEKAKRHD